jgi:hypothetical protein
LLRISGFGSRKPGSRSHSSSSPGVPSDLLSKTHLLIDTSTLLFTLPLITRLLGSSQAPVLILPSEGEVSLRLYKRDVADVVLCPSPPLPVLRTLDLLKKGTSPLAQTVRTATRFLESHLGSNSGSSSTTRGGRLIVSPPEANQPLPPSPNEDPLSPPLTSWLRNTLEIALFYASDPSTSIAYVVSSPTTSSDEPGAERAEGDEVRDALDAQGLGDKVVWVEPESSPNGPSGEGRKKEKRGAGQGEGRAIGRRPPPNGKAPPQQTFQLLTKPPSLVSATNSVTHHSAPAVVPKSPSKPQGSKLVLLQRPTSSHRPVDPPLDATLDEDRPRRDRPPPKQTSTSGKATPTFQILKKTPSVEPTRTVEGAPRQAVPTRVMLASTVGKEPSAGRTRGKGGRAGGSTGKETRGPPPAPQIQILQRPI